MQIERSKHLGAATCQRPEERHGYANGKSKTVQTRVDKVTFDIPLVREGNFYPSALESGILAT